MYKCTQRNYLVLLLLLYCIISILLIVFTTSVAKFDKRPANLETLSLTPSFNSYRLVELKLDAIELLVVGFLPKKSSELILVDPSNRPVDLDEYC